jgi:hypothetical protein
MARFRWLVILFFATATVMFSQQSPEKSGAASDNATATHMHSGVPTPMINGKEHPELIPDSTAYRLYFVAIGEPPNPSAGRAARQRAYLEKIGVGDGDLQGLVRVLADFKVQYASIIARFNASEEAAAKLGAASHTSEFLLERDQLVQATRDSLAMTLSPKGMGKFDSHIQNEKRRMQVVAKEGQ